MTESSFIKMTATQVQVLCEAKVAEYEKRVVEKTAKYAAKWRRTWRARIQLFITRKPLTDEAAAWKWCDNTYATLYPWWTSRVDDLLAAAQRGGEMYVSIEDFNLIDRGY